MYLEIITPEQTLFQGEISSAIFPGKNGSFQVLKDHAPIIAMLGEGHIKMRLADQTRKLDAASGRVVLDTSDDSSYNVELEQGVVEMKNNNIIVLVN